MKRNIVTMLAICVFLVANVRAQSSAPDTKFEVASIKPNTSGAENMGAFAQPGGRFGARNTPLRFLIRMAYDLKDFQILAEGSSWINTDRYDITAKAPDGTPNGYEPLRPMLQSLLADRFKLAFHRETRQLPIYEIVPAKSGLKLSPPKDGSCVAPDPQDPQPRERMPFCDNIRFGRGLVEAYGVTMPRLLTVLSDVLGRVVIDKTGSTAIFDARLEFAPDQTTADQPSIFTALQEQLGLKAEPAKGPVEVLIVDHVEKPTEN